MTGYHPRMPRRALRLVVTLLSLAAAGELAAQGTVTRPPAGRAAPRPAPRPPLRASEPVGLGALERELRATIRLATPHGQWGVMVVSLTRGDTLFAEAPDELLLPASTMKLYTAAMALERFGPAHQFRTEVLRDGPLDDGGTVRGSVYLKGSGDPSLSPRYRRWHDGVAPMDAIADLVYASGVRRITGDVVGDASAFDDSRVPA